MSGLTEQLTEIAKEMGCQYTIEGQPISYEQVFSLTGFLPALLRRADQLCSFCLGYGLGVTFERSDTAKLGVVAQLDDRTPEVLRLLCLTDVLYEFYHQAGSTSTIALDELMAD